MEGRGKTPAPSVEDELRVSEERYRALFEQAPVGVFVYGPDLVISACNERFGKILQFPAADLVGWDMNDIKDRTIFPAIAAAARGETKEYEGPYQATNSSVRLFITLRLTPMRDAHGHVFGALGIVEDNTERVTMQARLLQADRMVTVGTLAAGVAHEINNPLAYLLANLDGILGRKLPQLSRGLTDFGERLRDESVPCLEVSEAEAQLAQIDEMLRIARDGADRVRAIVGDLKTFSRGNDARKMPIDVRHVLDASINLAWNELRHRAKLVREYGEVPLVHANDARLGQVFLNLLVNAAQALPEGQARGHEIRVRTGFEGPEGLETVLVEVTDTGSGISDEVLGRIFDPFFTTKAEGDGTGLGLWIAQGIITSLGGKIEVASTTGADGVRSGTTFRVSIPAMRTTSIEPAPADSSIVSSARTRRARILIVDDEIDLAHTFGAALGEDHDVVTAHDGRTAIDILDHDPDYDIVLCDLMMPDVTGMDVWAHANEHAPEIASRMVFMTAGAVTLQAREFLEKVTNRRLEKPFALRKLRGIVAEIVKAIDDAKGAGEAGATS